MAEGSQAPVAELRGISKIYGSGDLEVKALDQLNLTVRDGDYLAVMGASGSGKSTAMNILGCLDTPSSGSYRFMGIDVGTLDRRQLALLRRNYLGFVFQGFNLLARTSALENVELPLIYRGTPPQLGYVRSKRFAAVFNDGKCTNLFVSAAPGDPAGDDDPSASLVENVLKSL